jgi:ABC-type uncharacterized transport system ATPase subunit
VTPELYLYTRANCGLCVEMEDALHAAAGLPAFRLHTVDIDRDPELLRRFGTRVPVLAAGGRVLCEGHFDAGAVAAGLTGPAGER